MNTMLSVWSSQCNVCPDGAPKVASNINRFPLYPSRLPPGPGMPDLSAGGPGRLVRSDAARSLGRRPSRGYRLLLGPARLAGRLPAPLSRSVQPKRRRRASTLA
jgi:hypothetical protein